VLMGDALHAIGSLNINLQRNNVAKGEDIIS